MKTFQEKWIDFISDIDQYKGYKSCYRLIHQSERLPLTPKKLSIMINFINREAERRSKDRGWEVYSYCILSKCKYNKIIEVKIWEYMCVIATDEEGVEMLNMIKKGIKDIRIK